MNPLDDLCDIAAKTREPERQKSEGRLIAELAFWVAVIGAILTVMVSAIVRVVTS